MSHHKKEELPPPAVHDTGLAVCKVQVGSETFKTECVSKDAGVTFTATGGDCRDPARAAMLLTSEAVPIADAARRGDDTQLRAYASVTASVGKCSRATVTATVTEQTAAAERAQPSHDEGES